MGQANTLVATDHLASTKSLIEHLVASISRASSIETPFYHLKFDHVFPDQFYDAMLGAMPDASDYRPMHGRARKNDLEDGTHTRVKIDLFPEYIRHLPPEKLAVWRIVGEALCSEPVKNSFRKRLAPGLEKRFGKDFFLTGMYPIPILTRDIPGYSIAPHTDTRWKGITVQLYLPRDDSNADVGTIFHEVLPDGTLQKKSQMKFAPNSGYAFTVGSDTWHSADPVHAGVKTRDSILLTYFVDAGPFMKLRNRVKRFGNFVLNEIRNRT